jgi:hypothetical protein
VACFELAFNLLNPRRSLRDKRTSIIRFSKSHFDPKRHLRPPINTLPDRLRQPRLPRAIIHLGFPILLLSLDFQAFGTNIYLETLWLLSILIEIVTKQSYDDDQCSDDQKQHVSIAEHCYPSP